MFTQERHDENDTPKLFTDIIRFNEFQWDMRNSEF